MPTVWPGVMTVVEFAPAALSLPSNVSGPLLAVTFSAFALVTAVLARRDRAEDCGCFGGDSVPATRLHAVVNACVAGLALAATPFLVVAKIGSILASAVLHRLDLSCKVTAAGFPKNYVVIARRAD